MTAGTTASVLGQSSNYRVIYDVIDGQPIILIVGVGIAGSSTGQCADLRLPQHPVLQCRLSQPSDPQ